jgi:hypothetical protein
MIGHEEIERNPRRAFHGVPPARIDFAAPFAVMSRTEAEIPQGYGK